MAHTEGAHDVVIGMAHRGRLSVLAHNIGRPVEAILAEFEGAKAIEAVKSLAAIPTGGTGDVKYHYGHGGVYKTPRRLRDRRPPLSEPEPPRVRGPGRHRRGARLADAAAQNGRLEHDPMAAVPVLLHGDAAFPAQGVVAETLNLQSLKGYATGGTIHIIQDNQIGFTTDPEEGRSTPYAADMAKGFNVPIIHVNADDPEACVAAVRLAMAYRERWGRDVVIDLIGYRRFGHNETDEPAYTQPLMAAKIKEHPPVSQLYAEALVKEGIVTPDEVEERNEERQKALKAAHDELRTKIESGDYADPTATGTGRARPHPQPERRDRGPGGQAPQAERGAAPGPGQLHHPPQAPQAALQAARRDERGRHRVRPRRGARAGVDADGGGPRPLHRPGHRARHLLQPPPRPPRREDGAALRADPEPARGERAARAPQQPALGDRLPRLRVRLLGGLARQPDPLGGPVRRLRQLGAGDHRQLHRLGRGEVGPDLTPHPAPAARLRGRRPRALERPHRALHPARRRGQHPARQPLDRGPVLPPAAAPGPHPEGAADGRLHARRACCACRARPRRSRT